MRRLGLILGVVLFGQCVVKKLGVLHAVRKKAVEDSSCNSCFDAGVLVQGALRLPVARILTTE